MPTASQDGAGRVHLPAPTMSPSAADIDLQPASVPASKAGGSQRTGPLAYTGLLSTGTSTFDVTSVIGREFPRLQLRDILDGDDEQKRLGQRLGEPSGRRVSRHSRPAHAHAHATPADCLPASRLSAFPPTTPSSRSCSRPQTSAATPSGPLATSYTTASHRPSRCWPRASPLHTTSPGFVKVKDASGVKLISNDRGAPENNDLDFQAEQYGCLSFFCFSFPPPPIRTNPATGWKSLFGAGHQSAAGRINGIRKCESDILKAYCGSARATETQRSGDGNCIQLQSNSLLLCSPHHR